MTNQDRAQKLEKFKSKLLELQEIVDKTGPRTTDDIDFRVMLSYSDRSGRYTDRQKTVKGALDLKSLTLPEGEPEHEIRSQFWASLDEIEGTATQIYSMLLSKKLVETRIEINSELKKIYTEIASEI